MKSFRFELGKTVLDRVTGYCGAITARAEYLYGPDSYLIESMDNTGRPIEFWVADDRLE